MESKNVEIPEVENFPEDYRSEMQEIISAPPPWLVQCGMSLFFLVLISLVGLTAFIRYPDIVKTNLKISSGNIPKSVFSKKSGRIVKLLIANNSQVKVGDVLAYMESTGNHEKILNLLNELKKIQIQIFKNEVLSDQIISTLETSQLGELQNSFVTFYQAYLGYKTTVFNGTFIRKRVFLQKELKNIADRKENLIKQKKLQEKTVELAKKEYEMHKSLFEQKVEAKMEFKREEAKFLASQQPFQQIESSLLSNASEYSNKEREIMELDNEIHEIKSSFLQSLNGLISSIEEWKTDYLIAAPQSGELTYSEFIQENQYVKAGQELYYVSTGNSDFFGVLSIPQTAISKVICGQKVLIKLRSFPYEEYGVINGEISSVSEIPLGDSTFLSRVDFDLKKSSLKKEVFLKAGMTGDAEVITEDATLLWRLIKNMIKAVQ